MKDERVGSLTQDELITELHRCGYDDVTKRQIADSWLASDKDSDTLSTRY